MSSARETTKPQAGEADTEHATQQEVPGGSGQDDPGEEQNDLTHNDDSNGDKSNDRCTDPSPSCGWRGVANAMGVEPGR